MNFANLYKDNREAVERALRAMWCGESGNDSQQIYSRKLQEVIREIFAPQDAVPVVQCMNAYETVHTVPAGEAKALVGGLWTSTKFSPYEHQYQCWRTLLKDKSIDGKPMSICVTTGTGSGKTECFMMPLVRDLIDEHRADQIQALFLYPLNALMEDQKERLEELLKGTDLSYSVYNGDLPEDVPHTHDHSAPAERLRKRIRQIRGWNEETGTYKYPHMLYTRKMVRQNPPNILLTNPTMLEYILLRGTDAKLINPALKSLRWIAIDETHTYTGAGAAELAMLLRRVLLAFGVKAEDLHFATSSATFGNGEQRDEEEAELREFIAGITGVHPRQVRVVDGVRIGEEYIPQNEDKERWKLLFHCDFADLNALFPGQESVEKKLELLDAMCQRVPVKDHMPVMKAKVHYFYRVPNNGLFVRLTEHEDGAFRIYSRNTIEEDTEENPLLELSRCKHCGEYVALTRINTTPGDEFGRYQSIDQDDSDMFDLEKDDTDDAVMKYAIIGLSKSDNVKGDNNVIVTPVNGKLMPSTDDRDIHEWHLVANTHRRCPYCNSKLTQKKDSDEEAGADLPEDMEHAYLQKFRTSADFISRNMAPSVLKHLEKGVSDDRDKIVLHEGQQYISFADSRQLAAKATLKQNLEQERMWFYSTIYHELCKRNMEVEKAAIEIKKCKAMMQSDTATEEEFEEASARYQRLKNKAKTYLTWIEIANLLKDDQYCPVFCNQFVKRSGDSDELDSEGRIPPVVMEKYVHSMMVMYLSSRPASAAAPETMGLFHSCYPQLTGIELPDAVARFNELLHREENKIKKEDWHDLLQIFMDYTVRSNQSLFLKISDTHSLDIFACERFATEKPRRRPIQKPKMEKGRLTQSRIVRYLCALVIRENSGLQAGDVYNLYYDSIASVVDALWEDVTNKEHKLLEDSMHWDADCGCFVRDKMEATRFNLVNLCFKLYENVYLCDTNTRATTRHTQCLRPVENNFKGFAPYLIGNEVVELKDEWHESWSVYPYYKNCGEQVTAEKVRAWAKEHRSLLWNNYLWGEEGVFENRLTDIHLLPNLFIQAEHTAQVDKDVSRTLQSEFKDHTINILACSTTMEMGVDLGNLEVVLLSSVPPQPANYKQRAGRSGRNNKVRSVCITLCGSDAIGLRTLFNPIENIINRPVRVPRVDLKSPQVIQRHVNSYLVRTFGVFTDGENGGKLTQKVLDYYTTFMVRPEGNRIVIADPVTNIEKAPTDKLGDETGTMYAQFNYMCRQTLADDVRKELLRLLSDTIFDGHPEYVIDKAREANERCYQELSTKLEDYSIAFPVAVNNPKFSTKLKMQYYEVLLDRLLNFWATSRFTPNANMPVNVLTLDLNSSGKRDFYTSAFSSNPSYGLREAIAQYAPGNNIVVDGVAYIVRGIAFSNMYQEVRAFKQIYRNKDKCVIDDVSLDGKLHWEVNEKNGLELIQPVGFIPDMNEEKSRIMDANRFTRVSAQLIDTDDWSDNVTEPHLFSVRNSRETGNAKILYYNEGLGYGYCFCSRCGRMTLETEVADSGDTLSRMPSDMNPRKSKTEGRPNYHFAITGKDFRKACGGSNDKNLIRRNVIIGDLVQTDYAEIRIRHKGAKKWMNNRNEKNLIFTLGIVFMQSLLDILGKERGAVDFAIMPNGHICLFDTNPGGAGYANQMASVPLMKDIINASKHLLENAKARNSKDMLLDKFTLRFIDYVDIDAALSWIQEEEESRGILPDQVAFVSKEATETDIVSLERAFAASSQESVLFVNNNYHQWNYNDTEHGWRAHFLNSFRTHEGMTSFCVVNSTPGKMPEPALDMLRSIRNGWASEVKQMDSPYTGKDIYPIAYIDGVLYFTNNIENSGLNDRWGNQTLYCARVHDISVGAVSVDCSYKNSTKVFMLEGIDTEIVNTRDLGIVIQEHSGGIVDQFIAHCKSQSDTVKITYQDEHLKSVLGMILTLQTIGHLVEQIGQDFSLEFLVEKYEDNNYKESITANLKNQNERDKYLRILTERWLIDVDKDEGIHGCLVPIKSNERNTLTHWRVLSLECAGKRLSVYPDGGFANGWNILKDKAVNSKYFQLDHTDTRDNIALKRNKDIKFDVTLEDVD